MVKLEQMRLAQMVNGRTQFDHNRLALPIRCLCRRKALRIGAPPAMAASMLIRAAVF